MFEAADLQVSLSALVTFISHTLATTSPLESPTAPSQVDKETTPLQPYNLPIRSDSLDNSQNFKNQDDHADYMSVPSSDSVLQPAADLSNTMQSIN